MEPEEVEFLSENSTIEIAPTFNSPTLHFITGDIGPFRAGIPIVVPLWLAMRLRKQLRCKIIPPTWMDIEYLEKLKEDEKTTRGFTKMPGTDYMVESKLILCCATEDITNAKEIRTIIKDIWDIRMAKLKASIDDMIKKSATYAAVDNLTLMEINTTRPLLTHAIDHINRMKDEQTTQSSILRSSSASLSNTFQS